MLQILFMGKKRVGERVFSPVRIRIRTTVRPEEGEGNLPILYFVPVFAVVQQGNAVIIPGNIGIKMACGFILGLVGYGIVMSVSGDLCVLNIKAWTPGREGCREIYPE